MIRRLIAGLSLAAACLLGLTQVGVADPGCAGGGCATGGCATEGCAGGDCACKHCQPTVELKKFDKRVYSCASHNFCYPPLFGHKPHCDGDGCASEPCFHCGHPHTRYVLVVKIRKEEKLVNTCKLYPPEPGSERTTELGEREALGAQIPSTGPMAPLPPVPAGPGPMMGQRERLGVMAPSTTPGPIIVSPGSGPSQIPGRVIYPTMPAQTSGRIITTPLAAPGNVQTLRNAPMPVPTTATPVTPPTSTVTPYYTTPGAVPLNPSYR